MATRKNTPPNDNGVHTGTSSHPNSDDASGVKILFSLKGSYRQLDEEEEGAPGANDRGARAAQSNPFPDEAEQPNRSDSQPHTPVAENRQHPGPGPRRNRKRRPNRYFDPDYCRRATEEFQMASFLAARGCEYSLNDTWSFTNNNVMVLAASGYGKTTSIVTPNIYTAVGSMFVCDPKGSLYKRYAEYFSRKGYKVRYIDFKHPERSDGYNPMDYIRNSQDILKLANYFLSNERTARSYADPFWERASVLLLASLIALQWERGDEEITISSILRNLLMGGRDEFFAGVRQSKLSMVFDEHERNFPGSYACELFHLSNVATDKTFDSIRISLAVVLAQMESEELRKMQRGGFDFTAVAREKTIVFVSVSDTERSMDALVNLFFKQAMNELCDYADEECEGGRLPIPVRFFLDDFATNCHIEDFPRMIASFRSRAISVVLMLQAESQLTQWYGEDARTIISNCSTYIYMGCNDIETAKSVGFRCDCPAQEILNMPTNLCWVIRAGREPVCTERTEPKKYMEEMEL